MNLLDLFQSAAIVGLAVWAIRERRRAQSMAIDPTYGTLTRVAFEASPPRAGAIVFLDVDGMHQANEALGYEAVDLKIRTAVSQFRQSRGSAIVCRWYSGDEMLAVVPQQDAAGAAERMLEVFREQGLGVTIGVCGIDAGDWREAVRVASGLVQAAKRAGDRGGVHEPS